MRLLKRATVLAALCFAATGCATAPENVQASYVSYVPYQGWTCTQLGEEQERVNAALASASTKQRLTRSHDTVGVILLGLPVSSMSGGNVAPEIARYKGELEAVQKAMILKSCSATPPAVGANGPS